MKIRYVLPIACVALFAACTADEQEAVQPLPADNTADNTTEYHCLINMQLQVMPFEESAAQTRSGDTRADSGWQWTDGTVLYLHYYNGDSHFRGTATYSAADGGSWDCSYAGSLAQTDRCEVYYFSGADTGDPKSVTLSASNAIWADRQAAYTRDDSGITLVATLRPLTARLRMKGSTGLGVTLSGVTSYTGYNADANTLTTSTAPVTAWVGNNTFTGYRHLLFTDPDTRQLSLTNTQDGSNVTFSCVFPAEVLAPGQTGYITIPTLSTNRGWTVSYQ